MRRQRNRPEQRFHKDNLRHLSRFPDFFVTFRILSINFVDVCGRENPVGKVTKKETGNRMMNPGVGWTEVGWLVAQTHDSVSPRPTSSCPTSPQGFIVYLVSTGTSIGPNMKVSAGPMSPGNQVMDRLKPLGKGLCRNGH